jgi:RNA polymerase sigma-70 factor (ECF subfamily)
LKLDIEQLRSAIARLTDEQAEVIGLRFLEGYSISEVAVMMNKTEGSIKALQYRAVANLRQLLLADS